MDTIDQVNPLIKANVEYFYELHTQADRYCSSDIVILYVNIRSAINKWRDFEAFIEHLPIRPDIIVVVETWLRESETIFYNLQGFYSFHCTRDYSPNQGRGGGTSVFIRNIPRLLTTCCDTVCFQDSTTIILKLNKLNCHIIATYRPEQTNVRQFVDILGGLLAKYRRAICVGDLNINLLENEAMVMHYRDTLLCNGHAILNSEEEVAGTRGESIIDHFCTDLLTYKYLLSNTEFSMSDHNALLLTVDIQEERDNSMASRIHIIDHDLADRSPMWDQIAITDSFDELSAYLQQIINNNRRTLTRRGAQTTRKPWITAYILGLISSREIYFKYHRRFPQNEYIENIYKHYKKRASVELKYAKKSYFEEKMSSNISNPKRLWEGIHELMYNTVSRKTASNVTVRSDNVLLTEPQEVCAKFSDYFCDVMRDLYIEDDSSLEAYIDTIQYEIQNEVRLLPATQEDILNALNKLKNNAASGYDGISVKFLKRHADKLIGPITNCINTSIASGAYPQSLKCASIVPLMKAGDNTLCQNYRPISVLSTLNMVFEEYIKNWFTYLLDSNSIIHPFQFGFRRKSNTETAVLHLTQFIAQNIQDGQFTSVLFLDLRKAFDSVDHRILRKKLNKLGLLANEAELLESYLRNRSHLVKIGNSRSSICHTPPVAVPQGSKMGPIMFNFMANDIHNLELFGKVQLFADDTTVKYSARSLEQLQQDMAHDISIICDWLKKNHLSANPVKTKFMVFAKSERGAAHINEFHFGLEMDGRLIEKVRKIEYLGVVIDDKLHWNDQVDKVRKEIAPYIFALRKMRPYVTEKTAELMYNAYVASRLTYASPAWRTASDYKLQMLRVLQHAALKSIRRLPWLTPSASLYSSKFLSVNQLLTFRLLLYIHKIKRNEVQHNFNMQVVSNIHSHHTRNHQNYYVGPRGGRTEEANVLKFGLFRYNQLPVDLKRESTYTFKKALRTYLSDLG